MPKKIVTALAFLLFTISIFAQQHADKDALQNEREQLRREIAETENKLQETRKTTKVNIGQLSLINKKMDLQGNVIDNINSEIKNLNNNIYLSQLEVNKMSRILDTLKQEYARSMVYAYKNRSNYDFLNFIFSANNFNDAIKRVAYLKSYRSYREMQAENILSTQAMLEDRIAVLSGTKKKKNVVLQEHDKELTQLEKQQQEKATIVNKLKSQQKELTAQVNAKRKRDAKLRNAISAMIKREIEIAKKEAAEKERKRLADLKKNSPEPNANSEETKSTTATTRKSRTAPKSTPSVLVSSEADKALNANFKRNKGSLPWPVSGYVISHYGANQLPGGINYDNPGVSIGAKIGESVKAVFDGEVTLVSYIEDKQAVYIKHGEYFTVYSNLASANVQRGQQVKTGQAIGKVGANDDGQGQVDFLLMQESNNINPEAWLRH
ncbi:MAG: peptidoglycan DD-metalloendopeptidase family protein [Bacteroidota bacterium]|nr:peptidoglycan DD-metalloendopeptidase family protein [Bacteroidota bacterium]